MEFDAIKFMHEQRDKISKEGCKLSKEEILSYCKGKTAKEGMQPESYLK